MQPSSFKSWHQAPLFIQGDAAEGAGGSQVRGDLCQVKRLLRNPSASELQASVQTVDLVIVFLGPFSFNHWPSRGRDRGSSKSTLRVHFYTPFFWGMHKDLCPWQWLPDLAMNWPEASFWVPCSSRARYRYIGFAHLQSVCLCPCLYSQEAVH